MKLGLGLIRRTNRIISHRSNLHLIERKSSPLSNFSRNTSNFSTCSLYPPRKTLFKPFGSNTHPVCEDVTRWLSVRGLSNLSVGINVENEVVRFSFSDSLGDKGKVVSDSDEGKGRVVMRKKRISKKVKLNELRFYRLKARKKIESPNPEVRIRYKLEKAKRKEAWLIEKLRKFDLPKAPAETYDPEILTEEEKFYLKRTGEKKKHYVPVGRRGVFGGVVLNMHLHWKNNETVKVVCRPCKPGQIHEFAEELSQLSKGIVIDIIPGNIIIFYRGRNYVQPEVMSPPDTLSKNKALEKYKYQQSLEHTSEFIERLEKELEEYQEHVARFRRGKHDVLAHSGED